VSESCQIVIPLLAGHCEKGRRVVFPLIGTYVAADASRIRWSGHNHPGAEAWLSPGDVTGPGRPDAARTGQSQHAQTIVERFAEKNPCPR
jgi:hypothetical protein